MLLSYNMDNKVTERHFLSGRSKEYDVNQTPAMYRITVRQ